MVSVILFQIVFQTNERSGWFDKIKIFYVFILNFISKLKLFIHTVIAVVVLRIQEIWKGANKILEAVVGL